MWTESQKWMGLALLAGTGWMIYLLAPMLTPFATAALLAYLGDPSVDWLERRGLSRSGSVVIVFCVLALAIVGMLVVLIPTLERQITRLIEVLPGFVNWLSGHAQPWLEKLGMANPELLDADQLIAMAKDHWQQAGGFAATALGSLGRSGMALLGWLMNLLLVPVVTFYLLRDWDILIDRVHGLLPRAYEPVISRLTRKSNSVLAAFVRGQLTVMLALGTIYSVGLWLIGLDLALLIGMLAGAISFVPYLGTVVGVVAGLLAALFQFGDITHVLLVAGVFIIGQMAEGMVLTPLLVGDKIGLHPVAVIFAVLAGGELFGFLGILLALPAASVIMVLLREAHQRYMGSSYYDSEDEKTIDDPVGDAADGDTDEQSDAGERGADDGEEPPAEAIEPA